MTDSQPRWPRGAPDDEHGHGQGGRWAARLSARLGPAFPSLKDAVRGRVSQDRLDALAHELEGEYGTRGTTIRDVHVQRWDSGRDGETDDGSFMPYGMVNISGAIVDPDDPHNMREGYFRVTAAADRDKVGGPLVWRMAIGRMHVRGTQGGGAGRELLERVVDWARQSGFDYVTVGPSEVGSYAWGAMGFDFGDMEDRKIMLEGALSLTVERVRNSWLLDKHFDVPGEDPAYPPLPEDDREIARMIRQYKVAAARAAAGLMSYQKLSQYGRKPGQGKNDWWAGKLGLIVGATGSGRMKL